MGKWMPVEDGRYKTETRIEIGVCGNGLNYYFGGPYVAMAKLPDDLRLCRLTDAPGDMPDDVRATMREALKFVHSMEQFIDTADGVSLRLAIDAALAYLDALP